MPFDAKLLPAGIGSAAARQPRAVALWLFAVCFMLLVMIVLGGATRLTGSGLSIMEWAPLSGALPPLTEAEWQRLYALYQQTPQYELLNKGFGIEGFRSIFWLEWIHRLWGRLIGVVFIVPLIWLWWRGAIERRLVPRLLLIFALGGLQGAVGWFMVASGFFPDSTAVAPVRLVVHLTLALALYCALLWTGLGLLRPLPPANDKPVLRRLAQSTAAMVALTIIAGGFVAGLHAGLTYNTFPLMDGQVVPDSYASLTPFWRNLVNNIATVQFDHRVLASLTALLAIATAALGIVRLRGPARIAIAILGALAVTQYALGVATLLLVVPVGLAVAHQATAVLLLTAALAVVHTTRRPRPHHPLLRQETP